MSGTEDISRPAKLWRGLTRERRWAIVLVQRPLWDLLDGAPAEGVWFEAPEPDRFWADPFPVRTSDGSLWVFVEEMHRWRGLGQIVAVHIEDGRILERRTVLRGRHHYSFPQIHRLTDEPGLRRLPGIAAGTRWIATTETCDPSAHVYTFSEPGQPWEPSGATLPVGLIDPALAGPTTPAEPWHLVAADPRDYFAGFRQWRGDEDGEWTERERLRFRDPSQARQAGNADAVRGLRSAQDCRIAYGMATNLVTWYPDVRGPGVVERRLTGSDFGGGAVGTHTMAWTPDGSTIVADVWWRGRRAVSGAHRMLEQRHGRICPGRRHPWKG